MRRCCIDATGLGMQLAERAQERFGKYYVEGIHFSGPVKEDLAYPVKAAFEDLYQRMHGMPLREIDRIVDAVCILCREHEMAGFVEGIKVGIRLEQELKSE